MNNINERILKERINVLTDTIAIKETRINLKDDIIQMLKAEVDYQKKEINALNQLKILSE